MISIVVPVYNVEKYLPQCLDSLIGQTYRNIEIICVNDGSTDGSPAILEEYAQKDERIKVVHQANQGLSAARNTGIDHAQDEWLMFVDGDDWLEPDCCEQAMKTAQDCELVFFSYIREFRTSSAPKYLFDTQSIDFSGDKIDWLFERLIAPNDRELANPSKLDSLSTAWGKCYRSNHVKSAKIHFTSTEDIGTEDLLFNIEYFQHVRRAHYLATPLYHYRKATRSTLSSSHKPALEKKWVRLFGRIAAITAPQGRPELAAALERRKALCLFGLGLNIVFSRKSFAEERQMLSDILSSDWYSQAVARLDTTPMPLHWRCFYGAARRRQASLVLLMLKAINIIINR